MQITARTPVASVSNGTRLQVQSHTASKPKESTLVKSNLQSRSGGNEALDLLIEFFITRPFTNLADSLIEKTSSMLEKPPIENAETEALRAAEEAARNGDEWTKRLDDEF
jgi:hypothetical protein